MGANESHPRTTPSDTDGRALDRPETRPILSRDSHDIPLPTQTTLSRRPHQVGLNPNRPLSILSIDDGFVRGILALYVLKELFDQVRRTATLVKPAGDILPNPRPCQFFDLICGTGTGGLIALMLGRLELDIDDAINCYYELRQAFSSTWDHPPTRYDHSALETIIQRIICRSKLGLQKDAPLRDSRVNFCRTFVVSTPLAVGDSIRMRSYSTQTADAFCGRIWEAARATTAALNIFAPINIDGVTYGSGRTGWSNPSNEALLEARNIWGNRKISCLLSIGSGLEEPLRFHEQPESIPTVCAAIMNKTTLHTLAIGEYCVRGLTDAERVHRELAEHFETFTANYYRLNVPSGMSSIGLDEWEQLGRIKALTESYMRMTTRTTFDISCLLLNPIEEALSTVRAREIPSEVLIPANASLPKYARWETYSGGWQNYWHPLVYKPATFEGQELQVALQLAEQLHSILSRPPVTPEVIENHLSQFMRENRAYLTSLVVIFPDTVQRQNLFDRMVDAARGLQTFDNDTQRNLLHFLAMNGVDDMVGPLVAAGFEVDSKDSDYRTALHLAVLVCSYDTVRALVEECGANVHARDINKLLPWHYALALEAWDHDDMPDHRKESKRMIIRCLAASTDLEQVHNTRAKNILEKLKRNPNADIVFESSVQVQ